LVIGHGERKLSDYIQDATVVLTTECLSTNLSTKRKFFFGEGAALEVTVFALCFSCLTFLWSAGTGASRKLGPPLSGQTRSNQVRIQGGDRPLKTYESNFIHHDFVQFGRQHSRFKAILPSIVLPQQWYEVYSTSSVLFE